MLHSCTHMATVGVKALRHVQKHSSQCGRQHSPILWWWDGTASSTSHAQAQSSTNYINSTDPRRMWSFLELIGAVTRPPLPRPGIRERRMEIGDCACGLVFLESLSHQLFVHSTVQTVDAYGLLYTEDASQWCKWRSNPVNLTSCSISLLSWMRLSWRMFAFRTCSSRLWTKPLHPSHLPVTQPMTVTITTLFYHSLNLQTDTHLQPIKLTALKTLFCVADADGNCTTRTDSHMRKKSMI